MDVTDRECPRDAAAGISVLVQTPCRTCHTPTFSKAGARRCFPELLYVMLESTETMTPKATACSYRRYDFTMANSAYRRVIEAADKRLLKSNF